MKKIGQKEILDAILKEALTIKRKRELFKEAQKINEELKQLNEYGHPGAMLGWGFKNTESPNPVLGLVTPSHYEEQKPEDQTPEECGCKLDQFPKLEKDIEEFGGEEDVKTDSEPTDDIQSLKDENAMLREKLAAIEGALGDLNEGMFDKLKAGISGVKAAWQTGKQAGQQQYQQTRQSQEIETMKKKAIEALQTRMAQLNKAGRQFNFQKDIQAILKPFGLQYSKKQIIPLAEGEEPGELMQEELDELFGKYGAMIGGAAKQFGKDVKDTAKAAGQAVKGAAQSAGQAVKGAAQQVAAPIQQYGQKLGAAAQAAGQEYEKGQDEKQAAAKAQAEKMQQVVQYNASMFNAAINALQKYTPAAAE